MKRKDVIGYFLGYGLGFFLFVIFIPLLLYLFSVFSSDLINFNLIQFNDVRLTVSLILLIIGLTFAIWSNLALFFIGKVGPAEGAGREISPKTKHLVISGPYKFTRNPMMFGTYTYYLAVAVYLNSISTLLLLFILLPFILSYLKKSEEKRLLKDFGKEFINYREKVSMFFPLPQKK